MCGTGVTSRILTTSRPFAESARIAASLPDPGPLTRPEMTPVSLSVYQFYGSYFRDWNLVFADVNMGRGAIVIGLAAVIIGEAVFSKIFRNFALRLLGVALGSILYYLVLQTVIWLGITLII